MESAPDAIAKVVEERGRWVVWLNVPNWCEGSADRGEHPVENNWHRINDYPTESAAVLAAQIIAKVVNRTSPPNLGY